MVREARFSWDPAQRFDPPWERGEFDDLDTFDLPEIDPPARQREESSHAATPPAADNQMQSAG